MKRRGFLALPALLAVPYIPLAAVGGDPYHLWFTTYKFDAIKYAPETFTAHVGVREAHRAALSKWWNNRVDQLVFEELSNVGHHGRR
jgi:hypothetical protein